MVIITIMTTSLNAPIKVNRNTLFLKVYSTNGLFFRTPDIGYDWEKNSGDPFAYFTTGAAVSEVEIDCLTGDHTVSIKSYWISMTKNYGQGLSLRW